jgi:hypothetical protein
MGHWRETKAQRALSGNSALRMTYTLKVYIIKYSIYICMYVCLYVYMYVCMYVCMNECMHACISIYNSINYTSELCA